MSHLKKIIAAFCIFLIQPVFSQELPPAPSVDVAENWMSSISYNINGQTLSKGIGYYDALGKPVQSQGWDILTHKIWANNVFYDSFGRSAMGSLSAPIGTTFGLNMSNFMHNDSNLPYTSNDFDNLSIPSSVSNSSILGSYYFNNIGNLYQDNTVYPFTRAIYSKLRPGKVKVVQGGNQVNGNWLQSYSFSMIAGQELSKPEAFDNDNYNNYRIHKTVFRDVHGVESVVFIDSDGNTLAAARSGNEDGNNSNSYTNIVRLAEQGWVDFHVSEGCSLNVWLMGPVDSGNSSSSNNTGAGSNGSGNEENQYSSESNIVTRAASFEAAHTNTNKSQETIEADLSNEFGRSQVDVYPQNSSLIPPIGYYYKVYDLITEEVVMQVVPETYAFPAAGFYRAELRFGTSITLFGFTYHVSFNITDNPELFDFASYGVQHCQNYYDYTLNTYDKAGRLQKSTQPLSRNLESTYAYNSIGQLQETSSPDEGIANFKYRKDGQIRFSQNSKQNTAGEVSFTDYDAQGRPIRSGVVVANFDSLDPDLTIIDNNYTVSELNHTLYDVPDTGLQTRLAKCGLPSKEYKQTFLYGNVSKTYTEKPYTNFTWYSYDVYGRVKWLIQEVKGMDCFKTINYSYDPITGQITKVDYQRHDKFERFVHKYEYNIAGQLIKVSTSRNDQNYTENAKYFYTETGALKRTEIAEDLQGIDYVYNMNGQLKAINSPLASGFKDPGNDGNNGFKADVFGMLIDYHDEDYNRQGTHLNGLRNPSTNNQFNGNIGSVRWHNSTNPVSMQTATYKFGYNKNNWMQSAQFGNSTHNGSTVSFGQDNNNDYEVSNITYDANGNLLTLKRNGVTDGGGNNAMDDFAYHYKPNTNQLTTIEDTNDNTNPNRFDDLKNQYQPGQDNYIYNEIGQLVSNLQDHIFYEYNASGLVERISTIGASNNGSWATLFFEDYANATQEDVTGWTNNNTTGNGELGLVGFSINHGHYRIGNSKCIYLEQTYGNSLNILLEDGVTAMRSFDVHPNVVHTLDLDLIVSQSSALQAGDFPPQYHVGYHIRVKDENGTLLATETINNPPQIITNDLPDGSSDAILTTCDYFYDNNHNFSFTPTGETIQLEIELITPDAPNAVLNIDNIHLQATTVPKLAYYYNDRNHRIRKETYDGAGNTYTTYYVRDTAGNPMAIYEVAVGPTVPKNNLTVKEYPVYGAGRLGIYFNEPTTKDGGHYVYQLTDHLGNVRAVVMKSGNNSLSLTNKTDYYPFGMPKPNRNIEGDYRYGYQGEFAEKEPEINSGTNSFELRLWDSRIGRWMSPDPYKEFFSPYLGIGNNPVSTVDPDGGETRKCPPDCDDLPIGSTPLIGEGGFINDAPIGMEFLSEVVVSASPSNNTNNALTLMAAIEASGAASVGLSVGSLLAIGGAAFTLKGDTYDPYTEDFLRYGMVAGTFPWQHAKSYDIVEDIYSRNNSSGYYLHYTSLRGAFGIWRSKVIMANSNNTVYLTNALMAPAEAFTILFQAQETHKGRGDAVIIMKLHNYQEAGLMSTGDVFELQHQGSLRPAKIIYAGPNPFGGRGNN